jgi:hypothetical protein
MEEKKIPKKISRSVQKMKCISTSARGSPETYNPPPYFAVILSR